MPEETAEPTTEVLPTPDEVNLAEARSLAVELLSSMPETTAATPEGAEIGPQGLPLIGWSGEEIDGGLVPTRIDPPESWSDSSPLPQADVVVLTWTSAEWKALHHVFLGKDVPLPTKKDDQSWRDAWLPYRRDFYTVIQPLWTHRLMQGRRNLSSGVPSLSRSQLRWGSWAMVKVAGRRVLLFKSELHINTDGETLPLRQLVRQILEECQPLLILSTGTSGGVDPDHGLGDVVVTTGAKFHLGDEFGSAGFNGRTYRSSWTVPQTKLARAEALMMAVDEYSVEPPTDHYEPDALLRPKPHQPKAIVSDLPLLTTDFFEYGTTSANLHKEGCCVEMDDAVVAMICDERSVPYCFVRNISDPVINSALPRELQVAWAVVTYLGKGLFTSFNSALTVWALIAG